MCFEKNLLVPDLHISDFQISDSSLYLTTPNLLEIDTLLNCFSSRFSATTALKVLFFLKP